LGPNFYRFSTQEVAKKALEDLELDVDEVHGCGRLWLVCKKYMTVWHTIHDNPVDFAWHR